MTAPAIFWTGNDHTQTGKSRDGRTYLLEQQGCDVYAWIDDEPLLDFYPDMQAARDDMDLRAHADSAHLDSALPVALQALAIERLDRAHS